MKNLLFVFFFVGIIIISGLFIYKLSAPSRFKNKNIVNKKIQTNKPMIKISSPVFENNGLIPKKYTCDGENINPPLEIKNIPQKTKSLVLMVDDPDAPTGTWTHWLVWNIPPQTKKILENSVLKEAVLGTNDFGKGEYGGPCPPSGSHRYFFRLYALDKTLNLPQGTNRSRLEQEIQNHIIDQGELMGKYQRN